MKQKLCQTRRQRGPHQALDQRPCHVAPLKAGFGGLRTARHGLLDPLKILLVWALLRSHGAKLEAFEVREVRCPSFGRTTCQSGKQHLIQQRTSHAHARRDVYDVRLEQWNMQGTQLRQPRTLSTKFEK